jgi:hypothetical protein
MLVQTWMFHTIRKKPRSGTGLLRTLGIAPVKAWDFGNRSAMTTLRHSSVPTCPGRFEMKPTGQAARPFDRRSRISFGPDLNCGFHHKRLARRSRLARLSESLRPLTAFRPEPQPSLSNILWKIRWRFLGNFTKLLPLFIQQN